MRSLLAIIFTLMLGASACGGSNSAAVGAGASNDEPESFEDIDYESPLADFLGQDIGGFEFDEAEMIEQQREIERAVAECMTEQGFEYTPRDPADMISFGGPQDEDLEPGSNAWIAKYGFGISTMRYPQSMVGDLVGTSDENFFGPPPDMVDPNQDYMESLSEAEMEAYQEALYGVPPDFGPEGPSEDFDFEPTGCQFEAYRSGPGDSDNAQAFYDAFGDELQSMWERIEADSRVVAFNNDIGACVAEQGMQWTGFQDVYEQFEPRLQALESDSGVYQDPFQEAGVDFETMSESEIREFMIESQRLDAEQLAVLAEIQADEIALAQAVIECGGGPVAEQKLLNEVRVEYEQVFLDENADVLAEYAAD